MKEDYYSKGLSSTFSDCYWSTDNAWVICICGVDILYSWRIGRYNQLTDKNLEREMLIKKNLTLALRLFLHNEQEFGEFLYKHNFQIW